MSTDKTLADVQPGGRVRLGDALRPCPFCGHSDFDQWPCEYIDASGANVVRCAHCHAAAPMKVWHDLSAQPSPACQDVRAQFEVWARWFAASVARSDDGEYASNFTNSLWLAWQAALAARQPVGEPVAYLDLGAGGYMDVGTDLSDEELAVLPKGRHMLGIIGTYGVDGYKPAQAVDLERFRPAVMTALGLSSPHGLERETLNELLDLIDSQA